MVDRYRPGKKTYLLVSLREEEHREDIDKFNIEWSTRKGFLRETEPCETEVKHRPTFLLDSRLSGAKKAMKKHGVS